MLSRPASRSGVQPAKRFVAILSVGVGLAPVGNGAVVASGLVFGFEPLTSLSGGAIGVGHALGLIALAYLIGLAGMACIVSPAVLLSTLTDSSLTAAAAALVLVLVMQVLRQFSYFDFLEPYLFTSTSRTRFNLLRQPIPWEPIGKALLSYAAYIVGFTLLVLGCLPPEGHLVVVTNHRAQRRRVDDSRRGPYGPPSTGAHVEFAGYFFRETLTE